MKLDKLKLKLAFPQQMSKFMPFVKTIFKQKWLKRLDRYIIVKFLGTYFFAIALIISISVVFDINENIDRFINNKAPLEAIIFDYYLNFIPYYTNLFSPLFVFIAVIFFTSKLAENSEIIAMFSTGMSFKRLMVPYMISAAIISAVTFMLGTEVIPKGSVTRLKFEELYKKKKSADYARNIQLEVDTGVVAYMERYENYNKTGYRFSLDKFEDHKLVSHLTARRITYDTASYHKWIIRDYMIREMRGMKEVITRGDRIDSIIKMEPQDFLITRGQQETMTSPQLRDYIQKQKQRGFANIKEFEVEYHRRIAMSFAAFILTAIGLSLSSRKSVWHLVSRISYSKPFRQLLPLTGICLRLLPCGYRISYICLSLFIYTIKRPNNKLKEGESIKKPFLKHD